MTTILLHKLAEAAIAKIAKENHIPLYEAADAFRSVIKEDYRDGACVDDILVDDVVEYLNNIEEDNTIYDIFGDISRIQSALNDAEHRANEKYKD